MYCFHCFTDRQSDKQGGQKQHFKQIHNWANDFTNFYMIFCPLPHCRKSDPKNWLNITFLVVDLVYFLSGLLNCSNWSGHSIALHLSFFYLVLSAISRYFPEIRNRNDTFDIFQPLCAIKLSNMLLFKREIFQFCQ